ncbi:hypothetical protein DPMN_102293 [Dreissena polymorpha]|uniref:Uncharacterized protein n=1 Tax=Dreissena polymorpha TaxID=45954 RepID=A0A9D4LJ17_DREPO|nr:hypothetical protein DPMN_102293 [Dreissena polymorpha]
MSICMQKTAPPPDDHFHEDWSVNVTPRVLTRKTCPAPWRPYSVQITSKTAPPSGGHVFQPTGTILKLSRDIIRTKVLTKFHEDWTKYKTSRVLTRLNKSYITKTAPPPGGHFHEGWTINVTFGSVNMENVMTDDAQRTKRDPKNMYFFHWEWDR